MRDYYLRGNCFVEQESGVLCFVGWFMIISNEQLVEEINKIEF